MHVPEPESSSHEAQLKYNIHAKYFHNTANVIYWKFRFVSVMATALVSILITFIVNLNIAYRVNQFVMQEEVPKTSDESFDEMLPNIDYTSIKNPGLKSSLDPDQFQEDKSYVIRKYTSTNNGSVMIISEFEPENTKTVSAVHAGSY